jgi:carboxymethylenebutenolidase
LPDTTFPVSTGEMRGYLATPLTDGPWPGVVVIHEAFGLTDDIRAQADRFAREGYLAFAPDLYSYGFSPRCLVATFRTMFRGGGGRVLTDIDSAREFVRGQPRCSGKVGIIGFCMGGAFAILAAPRGFDVSAPNYGLVPRNPEAVLRGSCAMVASYGAKDRGFKGAAAKLERALVANGVDHDVKEYPDAGHAFMTPHTGKWAFVDRVPGLGYVADAHDDAWDRVFGFFARHLG